jgi:hypothetical protein
MISGLVVEIGKSIPWIKFGSDTALFPALKARYKLDT